MATEFRKSGISVVGDVPWGTHFCHFYETKQDLLDTLIPYFKAGLERREFCLWVVSDAELLTVAQAQEALTQAVPNLDRHLADENIEIVGGHDWYFEQHALNLERAKHGWDAKLKRALARGFEGLRVSADTFWLAKRDWKDFFAYEKQVNDWIINQSMTVMCTYPLAKSGATEVLDVVQAHQFAIARRQGEWEVIESPQLIQAKAEIDRLNAELEQRVIERTKKLEATTARLRAEIEERKEAEEALRQSEERFAAFMDNLPGYAWMKDLEGRYVYINETFLQLRNAVGKTDADLWPELASTYRANDNQVIQTKNALQTIEPFPKDPEQGWQIVSKFPILDQDGAVVMVGGASVDITERIEAEAALRESEAKLRQAQHLADIGYWERDLIADRITWSEETGRILGLESFSGVPNQAQLYEFIHPDDRQHHEQVFNEALQDSRLFDVEVRFVRPDGGIRFVHIRDEIVRDEEGKPIRMFGAVQDITHLKQAEEAVRRSEEHLRLVIDTIPVMAWTVRPDGIVDFVNQRWMDYTGLSLEEESEEPTRPIHPEDVPKVMERWLEESKIGEPYEDELRLRRADGEYRWFLVRTAPLRDEQGNVVKWYGVSTDIEDLKRADAALKESQRRLEEAQRIAHVGHWDRDLETRRITWSDEIYRILGLPLGEHDSPRTEWLEVVHPEDRPSLSTAIEEMLRGIRRLDMEFRIVRPNGEVRFLHSQGDVIRDERGQPVRMFGTAQDITERKRAEEQLKATTEQLRALSARLQSAREQEGIRIARELHDELGAALSSLRWDFEEVVEVISGSADQSEFADLKKRIEGMIELTDTTVNAVRRIASELRPIALDELGLSEALEWQARQFQERTGIMVECDCHQENIELTGEQSTAVFRIFQEALTNILRHADATKVYIQLHKQTGAIILKISDNGRGITDDEKSGQVTLGLLGMRERAHLIGGTININGSDGEGTVITVRIPISP